MMDTHVVCDACGCTVSVGLIPKPPTPDGQPVTDFAVVVTRCPLHDLAEKMWQLLDDAETDTRQRALPDKEWHAKTRDVLARIMVAKNTAARKQKPNPGAPPAS
ncbi:MAG: hypothetical protein ACHP7J_00135 [Terriglobales bacterium]